VCVYVCVCVCARARMCVVRREGGARKKAGYFKASRRRG
jgi:hypothetical protein